MARDNYKLIMLVICQFIVSAAFSQVDTTGIQNLLEMSLSDLMNQKVVTASKFSQNSSEAASSIGVITADEIKNYNYRTLGEALNSQRGLYISNDKNYTYIGSRGFSRPTDYNNRIIIMIDGHITNEIVYGSAFLGDELAINMDIIEKIEIIRGPGASVYGSGAMLNIINVITKKGSDIKGVTATASAGSFGTRSLSVSLGKKINKNELVISGVTGASDGENYYFSELDAPETNFGKSEKMDWEKFSGLQGKLQRGDFTIALDYSHRAKGIPTGAFNTDLTGKDMTDDDRFYAEAGYNKNLNSNSSLNLRIYYDDYEYRGFYPTSGEISYDASTGRWFGGELQYFLKAGKRNTITAGIEIKDILKSTYHEWTDDTTYFEKNFPFVSTSFYAQDQLRVSNKLNFTAGFRFDHYSIYGNALSPRLALVYNYSGYSNLKLLYDQAFRIPNVYESFYESFNSNEANPDIKPESIRTTELAWSQKLTPCLYGNMSVYYYYIRNLIDQVLDEDDGLTQFRNVGIATGIGAEYELRYKNTVNHYQAYASISLQRAKDDLANEILTNSPAFLFKAGSVLSVSRYFNIAPEFQFETGRKTLQGNVTDNVYLVNIGINSARFLKYMEASLKVRNLLNLKYYYPGGYEHVQDALIQDSRSIILKLGFHF